MRWIRIGRCHRDPARCGEWTCCWVVDPKKKESIPCPHVKLENGLTACEYWGDPDKQDAAILEYMLPMKVEERYHACARFPEKPAEIGALGDLGRGFPEYADCGYDFLCSKCGRSFREHPQEDVIGDRCSIG